ncbi:kinase domain protein (macronuclear) [Tetrahymena thermophila SB210]|uniref:Kinase domain protein n=1 Tax=Tetrahymena thermophila (strain SB210) TaxID=312017 RepID=I7MIX0_TETTS|nr:kinase domain protein [Tetrahymena thermophila SB210]EAR95612.2 kinase domain protein [Tetrahymena thermophila SB210]|eukprot:XP_001015857.2 kinase domain protein [Tetrahymena thermophila SB210]
MENEQINQMQISQEAKEEKVIKDLLQKNKYEYQKVLVKGDFSIIVMAYSYRLQQQVAIKIIQRLKQQNKAYLQEFYKEIQVIQVFENKKYALQIIETIQDKRQKFIGIVAEICQCNLATILDLNTLSFEQVLALTYQLLHCLLLFQKYDTIHSDIKHESILYSKSKNQFKIANYGLSKIKSNPFYEKIQTFDDGKLCYRSPEVINGLKIQFNISVDIYSIGLLLTEAFIQRKLTKAELDDLKEKDLLSVLQFLHNSEQIQFIQKILSKMVNPNQNQRLQPLNLIKNLNALYNINEDCLRELKYKSSKLKNLSLDYIQDIVEAVNYDSLQINLVKKKYGLYIEDIRGMPFYNKLIKCQNIISLTLIMISVIDLDAKSLGLSLQKCQNIEKLKLQLSGCKLDDEGVKSIGMGFENSPNLTSLHLDLSSHDIRIQGIKNIAQSLQKCQNISDLDFSLASYKIGIKQKKEGNKIIVKSLEKLQKITSLSLSSLCLEFLEGIENIRIYLENHLQLSKLNLNLCGVRMETELFKNLLKTLSKFQNLTSLSLDMNFNQFLKSEANDVILINKSITYLNLKIYSDIFGLNEAKFIGMCLENCQNITHLCLSVSHSKVDLEQMNILSISLARLLQ